MHGTILSRALLACVLVAAVPAVGFSQVTYNWVGTTSDYTLASNWSPARSTPAATDILVFATGGATTVTGVPTQTVGELHVSGNTAVTVSGTASRTLTVAGGAAPADFTVASGSSLKWSGGYAWTVALGAAAVGVVDGDVVFTSTGASIAHRLTAVNQGGTVEGLTFNSGSTFQFAPGGASAGNPFGTTALNSVRFKDGSTFYQGGTTSGPSASAGSNPFAATAPNSVVIFDADSTYYSFSSVMSTAGRTYGNVIQDNRANAFNVGGSTAWVVLGDLVVKSTSTGNTNLNGAANPILVVHGNLVVEPGGFFNDTSGGNDPTFPDFSQSNIEVRGNVHLSGPNVSMNPQSNRRLILNGSTRQDFATPGVVLRGTVLDNPAGFRLVGDVSLSSIFDLKNGVLDTNGHTVWYTVDSNGDIMQTNGYVLGTMKRYVDRSIGGSPRLFPMGANGIPTPVSVGFSTMPAESGYVGVETVQGDHPDSREADFSLNYYCRVGAAGLTGYVGTLEMRYGASSLGSATESDLKILRKLAGSGWEVLPTTVNTTSHFVRATGITDFTEFMVAEEISAPVGLGGFSVE